MRNQHRVIDIAGRRFGRLTAHRKVRRHGYIYWSCVCDCGRTKVVKGCHLRGGATRSCGCLSVEMSRDRSTTHGMSGTRTHTVWGAMMSRCLTRSNPAWGDYGGRGITVCARWKKFENFLADMGERPENTSLDRVNNDDGYRPGNCRWATSIEQANNKRNNALIRYKGQARTAAAWSRLTGLSTATISLRIRRGWGASRTLETPQRPRNQRLGPATVRAIRAARRSGQTLARVASRFSVHPVTVCNIATGRSWGWLR